MEIPSKSETVARPVVPAPAGEQSAAGLYRVKQGDSLYSLSRRFGVSVDSLRDVNGLRSSVVNVGQKLIIPATAKNQPTPADAKADTYKVRRGDTLGAIAAKYDTTAAQLRRINGLKSNTLRIGQVLQLP